MFNKPPIQKSELKKSSDNNDKNLGFPSEKLGKYELIVREIFGERLNPSELYSMLLILLSKNIYKKTAPLVLREYIQNQITEPSKIKLEDYLFVDNLFVSSLDYTFESIVLSPIVPAGACSVINNLDPKTMLQTIKNSELIADASVALALESAKRRKTKALKGNISEINLATSHRETRMQKFNNQDFSPHYGSFTISSSSRDIGRFNFEKRKMSEHIRYFILILLKLNSEHGYDIKDIFVEISDISILEKLIINDVLNREDITKALRTIGSLDYFSKIGISLPRNTKTMQDISMDEKFPYLEVPIKVLRKFEDVFLVDLRESFPKVNFTFRLDRSAGVGYFDGPCYKIRASNSKGEIIPLVDGGSTDWTGKLLSDPGERFFASGIGTDILIKKFSKKYEV